MPSYQPSFDQAVRGGFHGFFSRAQQPAEQRGAARDNFLILARMPTERSGFALSGPPRVQRTLNSLIITSKTEAADRRPDQGGS